jgi:putative oxidoreductase
MEKPMVPLLYVFGDYGILALRVVLGVILIVHGWRKARNFAGHLEFVRASGFRPARFWAAVSIAAELGGGALILFGLFTQFTALIVALQFIAIIVKLKLGKEFGSYEFDLLILAASVGLLTLGAGAWSVDGLLRFIVY